MKRLLSLALALALVLSLALPVFAATTHQALADSDGYFNTKGLQITVRTGKNTFVSCDGDAIPYGETIYLPLKTLDGAYVNADGSYDIVVTSDIYEYSNYWNFEAPNTTLRITVIEAPGTVGGFLATATY